MTSARIVSTSSFTVGADHSQFYVAGDPDACAGESSSEEPAALRALDDARASGAHVGAAGGLVDVVTPVQWRHDIPVVLEIWDAEPPLDTGECDIASEFSLACSGGTLQIGPVGGGVQRHVQVPPASYRARLLGFAYGEATRDGLRYLLQLWPGRQGPLLVLKSWPGWETELPGW